MMKRHFTPPQLEFLDLCRFAFRKGGSDIHIEPFATQVVIRLRINGSLELLKTIETERKTSFSENVKSLLGFDMAKYGIPQDSRFSHPQEPVDFRANLLPSLYGEKICLRLLEREKDFHLERYSLPQAPKNLLTQLTCKTQGLIIVSGPTGSGKSTLLYSILGSICRKTKAVYTIEDPVEYSLAGLVQVPAGHKKLSFAGALRSLMRQDPDVMMVGEIRDSETAEAAVHAANTGHLVLTTVHANSAEDIFARLAALGMPRAIVEPAVLFLSAQRLPKKLCSHCLCPDPDNKEAAAELFNRVIDFLPQKALGCELCRQSGIGGRELIFEYMHRSGSKLTRQGSLSEQAFNALRKGTISLAECYSLFAD